MSSYANKGNLTSGPITGHLIRLTLPMTWGIFALISFQLVNTYYISRLGTQELAAISFTFPITYAVFSLFLGFGIATSSVASRLIGQGLNEDATRTTTHSILLVLIMGAVIAVFGSLSLRPLFASLGATPAQIGLIADYMHIYYAGAFFICLPIVINAALRARGSALLPAMILTLAAVTNAVVDPFLIFGLAGLPQLGLKGAAISTLLSNIFASGVGIYFLHQRGAISARYLSDLSLLKDSLKRLLVIALPAGIASALPSIVNSVLLALLANHGTDAVAAYGVANRVEAFCFIIMMGLASGMAPIIGQNYGAGQFARVRETIFKAVLFCVIWSLSTAVILYVFATPLSGIFSQDENVRKLIILYFTLVPVSYAFGNIVNGWVSALNAMGKPKPAASMLLLKLVVIMIPALYIGQAMAGVAGIFMAIAIVNFMTGIIFHLWAWKYALPR